MKTGYNQHLRKTPRPSVEDIKATFTHKDGKVFLVGEPHRNRKLGPDGVACYLKVYKSGRKIRVLYYKKMMLLAHHVVWVIENGEYPDPQIDHIDGDSTNNRIENLREVSILENMWNKRIYAKNKLGISGVTSRHRRGTTYYAASIRCAGTINHLYEGPDFFRAVCARKSAESRMGHLHTNHGRNL